MLSINIKVNAAQNKATPDDVIEFNNHAYKLFDSGYTQKQAIKICENLGGHLLTITSEEEQIFVNSIIKDCTMKNIWLGGIYTNNEWHWITDEDFVYLNWNNGEPNNVFNSQKAIMMYTYQGIDNDNNIIEIGKWNDENENGRNWMGYTSEETGFICEWDFLPTDNNDTNNQEPSLINNNDTQNESSNRYHSVQYIENHIENDSNQSDNDIEHEYNNDEFNMVSIISPFSIKQSFYQYSLFSSP